MALLLFNWCGYRLVANWLQQRAETRLEAAIDKGSYNQQQLVELSVVTNLPYTNDWLDWERTSGTIEVNGYHYQYVERKLEKGKMLYHCLPNNEKQMVVNARDEFFQLVNSFNQQNDQKPSSSKAVAINNFIGDYDDCIQEYITLKPETSVAGNHWPSFEVTIPEWQVLTPEQPPELG